MPPRANAHLDRLRSGMTGSSFLPRLIHRPFRHGIIPSGGRVDIRLILTMNLISSPRDARLSAWRCQSSTAAIDSLARVRCPAVERKKNFGRAGRMPWLVNGTGRWAAAKCPGGFSLQAPVSNSCKISCLRSLPSFVTKNEEDGETSYPLHHGQLRTAACTLHGSRSRSRQQGLRAASERRL